MNKKLNLPLNKLTANRSTGGASLLYCKDALTLLFKKDNCINKANKNKIIFP